MYRWRRNGDVHRYGDSGGISACRFDNGGSGGSCDFKIVYPETEESQTKNEVKVEIKKNHVNLIDAIAHGASDGMKVSINVIAMLIALIALISMIDWILGGRRAVSCAKTPSQPCFHQY